MIEKIFLLIKMVLIFDMFSSIVFLAFGLTSLVPFLWVFQDLISFCCMYIFSAGLELLLELLESTSLKQKHDGSEALYKLATKATSLSPVDAAPLSPNPQVLSLMSYSFSISFSCINFSFSLLGAWHNRVHHVLV
jgi:hypothetical protein